MIQTIWGIPQKRIFSFLKNRKATSKANCKENRCLNMADSGKAAHHPSSHSGPIKTHIVIGTRPEAIKMAPIYLTMRRDARFEPVLISSGQHREMLDQTLS